MRYRYLAYNAADGIIKGEIAASSEAEAGRAVREQGYKPLELRRLPKLPALEDLFPSLFSVPSGEIVRFARQLATLTGSGTGLVRALELAQKQTKNRTLRRSLASVMEALDRGESFSSAISRQPKVFGQLFCRVVEVGEYTGRMDTSLRQIADLMDRENQARKKALRSLMYPVAVVLMALGTTGFLFTVALPPLLKVFERMDAELPLATRMAVTMSVYIQKDISYLLIGLIAAVIVGNLLLRMPRVRYRWHALRLRLPLLGPVTIASELSRFSRSSSILLGAGVSVPVVMSLAVEASGNLVVRRALSDAADGVMRGEGLAAGLARYPVMPAVFVQMVAVGEESNSLPQAMGDTADAYQQQMEEKLNTLVTMLEPAATLGVALLIGFIAYSMFVPIYSSLSAF